MVKLWSYFLREKWNIQHELFKKLINNTYFSASKSPYAHLLDEYVEAEEVGKGQSGAGECFPYFKACPKSLFKSNNYNSMTVATLNKDPSQDSLEKQSTITEKNLAM